MPILRPLLRGFGYLYPLYSGCGTIANAPIFRAVTPSQPILVSLKNKLKVWIDPTDYIGKSIYYFGELDPKVTFICRRLLEKGDIFIDIGANMGLVSLNCADILQDRGEIHAFEPNPDLVEMLNKTVAANQMKNFVIHRVGLSDRDGNAQMYICSENQGRSSLSSQVSDQKISIAIRDSARALSEIIENNDAPYLIKIDIEGDEHVVIKRAKKI